MNEFQFLVLKGRHIQAQGNPEYSGVALGWGTGKSIVRARTFIKEKFQFRTKEVDLVLSENDAFQFSACSSYRVYTSVPTLWLLIKPYFY